MINFKKASLLAVASMALSSSAFASSEIHDVVKDKRGNVVTNSHGNCVVTKWTAAADECGGQQQPKEAKKDIRSRLSKEDRTVYFDFNKSVLRSNEKSKLDEVSRLIRESKQVESVDIIGYADMIGKSSYNQKLSMKRAESVKSYLAAKGLKTRNVKIQGKGESGSVTKCDPKMKRAELIQCLAEDRRVEIELNLTK